MEERSSVERSDMFQGMLIFSLGNHKIVVYVADAKIHQEEGSYFQVRDFYIYSGWYVKNNSQLPYKFF